MSHLKPYPAYKDSGVEWFGNVPVHWSISQMKSGIESLQNGVWGDEPTGGADDVPCARVADFDRARLIVAEPLPTIRSIPRAQRAYKNVRPGDLLLEKSGGGEQTTVGAMVQYVGDSEVVCSNFVAAVKCKDDISARWLCYVNSHLYALGVNTRSIKQTTGIQNLDSNQYSSEPVAFPTYGEQQAIATHLDRETTRIDALITKKTRFIELLREKRQALITHAVTKGLDPNVKMKNSGVEWLGEVPEHWGVVRFRDLCASISTGPFGTALGNDDYVSGGIPVINPSHIIEDELVADTEISVSQATAERLKFWRLNDGDLVAARRGELGRAAVVTQKSDGWICGTGSLRVRPNTVKADVKYLHLVLQSRYAREWLNQSSVGATMANLNEGILGNLPVACPKSVSEQSELVSQTIAMILRVETLSTKTERSIELLKERRSALITAAVTGQIDLRETA